MKRLSREDLLALAAERQGPCVSIYQPADAPGREALEGPIRFKNLLDAAEDALVARGVKSPDARAILQGAHALRDDPEFFRAPGLGLALFAAPGFFEQHRLPLEFSERVTVGESFSLKPLFPMLTGNGRFYLLSLSQNQVRLFEGDRHAVREVELEANAVKSLAEWTQYDEESRSLQFHTGTDSGGAGERAGVFFGSGGAERDNKDEILQWFQRLEESVEAKMRGENAPLVLAGVEYLLPLYRQASGYTRILDEVIAGNQEMTPVADLHCRAWELVEPHFADEERAAREDYAMQAGRGNGLNRVGEVLRAAHDGRIATLFARKDAQRWGQYDAARRKANERAEAQPGDRDLLDLAATQTLLMGGTVFVVDEVPGGGDLAAVARY